MSSQVEKSDRAEPELERMHRKHSLLQNEIKELRDRLSISGCWTWIWFVSSCILLMVAYDRLVAWLGS